MGPFGKVFGEEKQMLMAAWVWLPGKFIWSQANSSKLACLWGRILLFSKLVYSDVVYSNTILLFVCLCVTHTNERIVLGLNYLRDY